VGVREDLERIRSGMRAAQAEVDPWLDRWAAGEVSQEQLDQRTRTAQGRMEALERELDQLRRYPGDGPGTDLDLLIADVEDSLAAVHRRQATLSAHVFADTSAGAARRVVAEQIRQLEQTLAHLRPLRAERTRFTERAATQLRRAVKDGVIDQQTVERLRTYLD
jgi:ABC-type transporter Mla subunit MlaD